MSTKIFTGFRVPMTEMHQLHSFLKNARKMLFNKWMDDYKRDIAQEVTRIYDCYQLGMSIIDKDDSGASPFRYVMAKEWMPSKEGRQTFHAQKETLLYVSPHPDYLIGLSNQTWAYETLLESGLGVEEFGYWNNTDKPDELSDEDWDFRKRVWDDIVGYGDINQYTLAVKISPPYAPILQPEEMDGFIPDFEARTKEVAKVYKSSKMPKHVIEQCQTYSFVPFMEWMQSGEAKEYYKEGLALAKNTLAHHLTGQDLDNIAVTKDDK